MQSKFYPGTQYNDYQYNGSQHKDTQQNDSQHNFHAIGFFTE